MEPSFTFPALIAALALAAVHILARRLRFLSVTPRSRWLSAAGGASVAYVFLHLLPELGVGQAELVEAGHDLFATLDYDIYIVALLGLVVFYGLERLVAQARLEETRGGDVDEKDLAEAEASGTAVPQAHHTRPNIYWLHISSFTVYNFLIGYLLLHREQETLSALVVYAIAMGLHFVVNDFGLQEDHRRGYRKSGRWILSGAVLTGWAIGALTEIPELGIVLLTAFIGGGVILNVLKEELPENRESRFSAFLIGAAAYAVLLLAL